MNKSYFSIFADDFKQMKSDLTDNEIVDLLSCLSDFCYWGESDFQPKNKKQQFYFDKLKAKFDKDLQVYETRRNAGKKGMDNRWSNKDSNKDSNKKNDLLKENDNKQDIHLNTLTPISSDKSSDIGCVPSEPKKIKKLVPTDWQPEEVVAEKIRAQGLDVSKVVEKFINSCRAKGLKYIDFNRAILAWDWSKDVSVKAKETQEDWYL